ncbi:MAG: TonB-dependent receptor, partial [Pseudomonadota bacterium]
MADRRRRNWGKAALLSMASTLAMASGSGAHAQLKIEQAQTRTVDIPAGPLGEALIDVADTYGVDIFAADDLVAGKRAPRVSGALTAEEAVAQVVVGSGLKASPSRPGEFIVTAAAQDTSVAVIPPSSDDAPADVSDIQDTVVVTGSRIERTAVDSPSPIDIVTADDIAVLGLTDTTEALRFTPALNQSLTLSSQGQFNTAGPTFFGLSTLDLRGLGTNRTLVLVNGRRHVGGVANEATVDVASIPAALIDRVEVLTGGGSSIYGADAVSGVVNYVLKDDFEGVDLRANASLPTRGDGEAYFAAITVGGNFSDGRGNAVLSAEYNKQTVLRARDRASSSRNIKAIVPNTDTVSAALGADPQFRNVVIDDPRFTFFAPGPLISFGGSTFGLASQFFSGTTTIGGVPIEQFVDANTGEIRPRDFGNFVVGTTTQGGDGASTEFANQSLTTIPNAERYVVNALADFDFTDQITGFIEVKYSRNESTARANLGAQTANTPVLFENPFIPSSIREQFVSLTAQDLDPALVVTRTFFDDVAAQDFQNTRQTFRVVGGLSGSLSEAFSYEVSANYGRTDTSSLNPNQILSDRFVAATDVIADPLSGNPICRSDIDADTTPPVGLVFPSFSGFTTFTPGDGSCSPLNIFAPLNALDPNAAAFVFQPVQSEFELEQFVFNATVTGNSNGFLELPAGGIGYALGIEYRDERSSFRPDPLQQIGLVSGSPAIIEGEFDVFEGFAEVSIPVLRDAPFAKSLSIDASVRVADYSFAGTATSYAFGTVWQPTDDLRLRASYNRSIRAPNISELFSPQRQNVDELSLGTDPCDPNGVTTGSSTRAQNCA